jgi:hypothetical protein
LPHEYKTPPQAVARTCQCRASEMAEDAILHDTSTIIPNRIWKKRFFITYIKLLQPEIQSVQCLILVPSRG